LLAIGYPYVASVAIEQLIGIVCPASGVVLLLSFLFGKAAGRDFCRPRVQLWA